MKKTIYLLICLLGAILRLPAQEHLPLPKVYRNGQEVNPAKQLFRPGDNVTVEIKGINTFLYDVKIGTKSISYDLGEQPDIIKDHLVDLIDFKEDKEDKLPKDKIGLEGQIAIDSTKSQPKKEKPEDLINQSLNKIKNLDRLSQDLMLLVVTTGSVDVSTIESERNRIVKELLGKSYRESTINKIKINKYFRDAYSELQTIIAEFNDDYNGMEPGDKMEKFGKYLKINTIKSSIDEETFNKKLEALLVLYDKINPESFYISHTFPINRKSDEISINYELRAKDDLKYVSLPKGTTRDSLTLMVGKRFTINYSSGIFLTGLDNYEYSASSSVVPGDTVQLISLKNSNTTEFAAGALVHVYSQIWKYINPTLSVGIALNGDSKPRYLGGLGLILGRGQRIVLNGGTAFGETERLAEHQSLGQEVNSFDEVQTVQVSKVSWFVGLTYNF